MAERENIVLSKGLEHIFNQGDIGKYKIVAHKASTDGSEEEHIYATREIRIIDPTPIGDITPGTTPASAFITGTDTQYLSILYNLKSKYDEYTVDKLNAAAYTYIKDWNSIVSDDQKIPVSDTPSERPVYFGEDSNGIFALLIPNYSIDMYDDSIKYISGDNTYIKAYVKGTCSIVDAAYAQINDSNMISSIAYPFTFLSQSGKYLTYLFINSSIQLLKDINTSENSFKLIDSTESYKYTRCEMPTNLTTFKTLLDCENYILKFTEIREHEINTVSNPTNNGTAMMISEGTTRNLIIPETVKKISHFYGGGAANVKNIILPSSLKEIGESAFEGIAGGSITLREYNDNLEVIGYKAFAHASNAKIFTYNIETDKTFIINNMSSGDKTDQYKLKLDNEQIDELLTNLSSGGNLEYTLLPRVKTIQSEAFGYIPNSASIKNIIFTNILSIVAPRAFTNTYMQNIIIPKPLVARPQSAASPNNINNEYLLYLPEMAIAIACSTQNDTNIISNSYQYIMNNEAHYNDYNSNGYIYNFDNNVLTNSWLANRTDEKLTFSKYITKSQNASTFENITGNPHFYFIHTKLYS